MDLQRHLLRAIARSCGLGVASVSRGLKGRFPPEEKPSTPHPRNRFLWRVGRLVGISCLVGLLAGGISPSEAEEPATAIPTPTATHVQALEERFESLEKSNRELSEQFDRLLRENESLTARVNALQAPTVSAMGSEPLPPDSSISTRGVISDFDRQPPDIRTTEPTKPADPQTNSSFFEGFKWETEDGEYTLNFHNETQLDTRIYTQAHLDPVNQFGFYISRLRMIFNGRLTKPIEYNLSINKGMGSLDLLDAYFNFNYDPRFQFRIGRYRVPFTYDWFALSNQFLPTPERSVFAINHGYNRNFAAMLHGELWEERVDYALAAANGPRNSYYDTNASKDVLGYLNVRPFMEADQYPWLKHLNVGGSMTYGLQAQSPLPVDFRTSANATESEGTEESSATFLRLNDDVAEQGVRKMWELHFAYYYRQLTLMGAYDSGFNDYLQTTTDTKVRLPTRGYHVQFGYFLTGEEVERRTFVEPLCPFDLREGKRGYGAFELQARFDHFDVGDQVFTGNLADPGTWTNSVNTVDAGVNWYLNRYMKIYFDWQHAMYDRPVMYRPGGLTRHSDLFWIRTQVYF